MLQDKMLQNKPIIDQLINIYFDDRTDLPEESEGEGEIVFRFKWSDFTWFDVRKAFKSEVQGLERIEFDGVYVTVGIKTKLLSEALITLDNSLNP